MNPDQQDLTLEESMKQVLETLPPFLRAYLTEGKYTPVAQRLMAKYKLRIDQAAVLERELMLLLMGIENPAEFTQALIEEAKVVDQMTVKGIVQDINEQVFIPLRKEEENLSKGIVAQSPQKISMSPQAPLPPASAVQPQPQSRPASVVVPLPQRPAAVPAPHIAPLPPKMAMPGTNGSLGEVLRSVMKTLPSEKPLDTSKLLEDHEEPHIEVSDKSQVVSPSPTHVPTPEPLTPPNSPLTSAPLPERETEAPALVQPVPPASAPRTETTPPLPPITSYSSDPYREPIDEN